MDNIFMKEEQVILEAEKRLSVNSVEKIDFEEEYKDLLEEYKALLKQMIHVVKLSDMMQLELKNISENLEKVSRVDVLTGLFNRRFFNEIYLKEWKNAVRSKNSLAIIMADIDYFKKYNDAYGHLQGDKCLAAVAKAIERVSRRPRDIVARFGGEEFVVLLPETGIEGAATIAKLVLSEVEALALEHKESPISKVVTVSIGAASIDSCGNKDLDSLVNMADNALYTAKKEGRNCVRIYNSI